MLTLVTPRSDPHVTLCLRPARVAAPRLPGRPRAGGLAAPRPGRRGPPVPPGDQPTYGARLPRVRPSARHPFTAVHVNGPAQVPELIAPGQFAGFLGRGCEPLLLGDVTQEPVALRGLDPDPELPPVRT